MRSTQVSKRLSTDCALCDGELKEKATVRGSVDMVRRVGIRAWPPSLNAVLAGKLARRERVASCTEDTLVWVVGSIEQLRMVLRASGGNLRVVAQCRRAASGALTCS